MLRPVRERMEPPGHLPEPWMALTSPELVRAHLNLDQPTIDALSTSRPIVVF
jgi:hypothetical protein